MKPITQLDELKVIELDIMKVVHRFCVEHGIKYYLGYGTLLGAMRHKGFIPWDDDIDLWMTREDYERFLTLFPQEQDKLGMKLVNHRTKPFLGRAMSKVIDVRTVLTEPEYRMDDPIGVFVDIWPLDAVPNDDEARKRFMRKLMMQHRRLYWCITRRLNLSSAKEIVRSAMILLNRPLKSKKQVGRIEGMLKGVNEPAPKYLTCPAVPKILYQADWFQEPILTQFEDAEFYAPARYDDVLTAAYGDWRKLPPKEQQVPHHVINVYWK